MFVYQEPRHPARSRLKAVFQKAGCLERDGEGEHHDDADVHDVDAPDYDDVGKYDDPDDNDDVVACPITIALTETMMIPVTMTMLLPVAAVFLLRVRRSHYKKNHDSWAFQTKTSQPDAKLKHKQTNIHGIYDAFEKSLERKETH